MPIDHKRDLEHRVKMQRQTVLDQCQAMVNCIERFLEEARQHIAEAGETRAQVWELPQTILHDLQWGHTNAFGRFEDAQRNANRLLQLQAELTAVTESW